MRYQGVDARDMEQMVQICHVILPVFPFACVLAKHVSDAFRCYGGLGIIAKSGSIEGCLEAECLSGLVHCYRNV